MFVTFESVKSGVPIELQHPIDNKNRGLNVILHEIFYTVKWLNISHDLNNNWIMINKERHFIHAGYYDFCRLTEELFKPHSIEAKMNPANLIVTLTFHKTQHKDITSVTLAPKLAQILGFRGHELSLSDGTSSRSTLKFVGSKPMNLLINNRLFVHLHQLKTSENLVNGTPSTLLRIISTQRESYCDPVSLKFLPQKRHLSQDYHTSFCFKITNQNNEIVDFEDLTIILEIK